MGAIRGMDCILYRNTGTYGTPTWNPVPNVRDVTIGGETDRADATTRGNNGFKAMVGTLKDISIEFEMLHDTGDDDYTTFKTAWLNGTIIEVAATDGAIATPGTTGVRFSASVTKFARTEPLADMAKVSVMLNPAYASVAPSFFTTAS